MNFKQWLAKNRKPLEQLKIIYEKDTGDKIDFRRFVKWMYKETTNYKPRKGKVVIEVLRQKANHIYPEIYKIEADKDDKVNILVDGKTIWSN